MMDLYDDEVDPFDDTLEQIREWEATPATATLASLGLTMRCVWGVCQRHGEQWELVAGVWQWPMPMRCWQCGKQIHAERWAEWPE